MSQLGYLIWFATTAILVMLLLGFGIMIAAGILPRKRRPHDPAQ